MAEGSRQLAWGSLCVRETTFSFWNILQAAMRRAATWRETPIRQFWVLILSLPLPWASRLIFLSLHFVICKLGVTIIIASTRLGCIKD